MIYSRILCISFGLILIVIAVVSPAIARSVEPETLDYTIRPIPRADRTDLEITVSFRVTVDTDFKIKLPTDNFGTPDLHKFVTKFEGLDGTSVSGEATASERLVRPGPNKTVHLRYVLSYDPKFMEGYAYGPNTGSEHFHLAGCQWLLHIGPDEKPRKFNVKFSGVPKGWHLYTSKSATPRQFTVESSYDEWISAPIGGGKNLYSFDVKGGKVSVFVHGNFDIPKSEITLAVEKIVRTEREWFRDFSQPRFTVVLAPRPWVVSGYAPDDSFVCFIKPDITRQQLFRIVAHELFHTWLPNKIEITVAKGHHDLRHEWITEGFTDYFARRILKEAGFMSDSEFADSINADIKSIADDPYATATYDDLVGLAKSGSYGAAAKKLAYFRGALIALNWNEKIQRSGKGQDLAELIREIYSYAGKSGGKVSEDEFFKFVWGFGVDAAGDFDSFIVRGQPIIASSSALGSDYELREEEYPLFDIGFSLDETYRNKRMTDVREDGPAYNAGLRDGMPFVGVENSARFSNAWTAEKPLVVVLSSPEGERRIQYFPQGRRIKLNLFARRSEMEKARVETIKESNL